MAGALDSRGKGSRNRQKLVECFTPFLLHLATSGLSKNTIQRHVNNPWILGGELVPDLNEEPSLRMVAAPHPIRRAIHEDGGPLIYNGGEDEQRFFDSTCRKFHKFLPQFQR